MAEEHPLDMIEKDDGLALLGRDRTYRGGRSVVLGIDGRGERELLCPQFRWLVGVGGGPPLHRVLPDTLRVRPPR